MPEFENFQFLWMLILGVVINLSLATLNTGDAEDVIGKEGYINRNSDGIVRSLFNDAILQKTNGDNSNDISNKQINEKRLKDSLDSLDNVRRSFYYEIPRAPSPRFEALTSSINRTVNNVLLYSGSHEQKPAVSSPRSSGPNLGEHLSFVSEPNVLREQPTLNDYYSSFRDKVNADPRLNRGRIRYVTPQVSSTESYHRGRNLQILNDRGPVKYSDSILPATTYRPPFSTAYSHHNPVPFSTEYPISVSTEAPQITENEYGIVRRRGNVKYINSNIGRDVEVSRRPLYSGINDYSSGITTPIMKYPSSYGIKNDLRRIYLNRPEIPSTTQIYPDERFGLKIPPVNAPEYYSAINPYEYGGAGTERGYMFPRGRQFEGRKLFIPASVTPVTWASSTPPPPGYSVHESSQDEDNDGSYFFRYNAGDHAREESRDRNGRVVGKYSYISDDGRTKVVEYEADSEKGFVARGEDIPLKDTSLALNYNVGVQ